MKLTKTQVKALARKIAKELNDDETEKFELRKNEVRKTPEYIQFEQTVTDAVNYMRAILATGICNLAGYVYQKGVTVSIKDITSINITPDCTEQNITSKVNDILDAYCARQVSAEYHSKYYNAEDIIDDLEIASVECDELAMLVEKVKRNYGQNNA